MKPLELTVYRHCNCVAYCTASVPVDMEGPDIFGAREGSEDHVRHPTNKRLTAPELAAEYHALDHRFTESRWVNGDSMAGALTTRNRLAALYRFATLPHYDEVES